MYPDYGVDIVCQTARPNRSEAGKCNRVSCTMLGVSEFLWSAGEHEAHILHGAAAVGAGERRLSPRGLRRKVCTGKIVQ